MASARDGDTLLLAAGKFAGKLVGERGQSHAIEQSHSFLLGVLGATVKNLDLRQGEIAHDGEVGEQLEMLKYHADTRAQLGQVGPRIADRNPVDENLARRNCVLERKNS